MSCCQSFTMDSFGVCSASLHRIGWTVSHVIILQEMFVGNCLRCQQVNIQSLTIPMTALQVSCRGLERPKKCLWQCQSSCHSWNGQFDQLHWADVGKYFGLALAHVDQF